MIILKHKTENRYLITNYKVMYSTIASQENIEEIQKTPQLLFGLISHYFNCSKSQYFLLVRNPYERVESFFKNKFRSTLPRILKEQKWQRCHEIFFPHLGLHTSPSPEDVAQRLSQVSFSEFVALLPKTYNLDGHLYPQHWSRGLNLKFAHLKMPIRMTKIFRMESQQDLNELSKLFDINLARRENSTESIQEDLNWANEDIAVVNHLYKTDFVLFNYKQKKT